LTDQSQRGSDVISVGFCIWRNFQYYPINVLEVLLRLPLGRCGRTYFRRRFMATRQADGG
jgi:hypothetical protein